jgi:hypothetical protein
VQGSVNGTRRMGQGGEEENGTYLVLPRGTRLQPF